MWKKCGVSNSGASVSKVNAEDGRRMPEVRVENRPLAELCMMRRVEGLETEDYLVMQSGVLDRWFSRVVDLNVEDSALDCRWVDDGVAVRQEESLVQSLEASLGGGMVCGMDMRVFPMLQCRLFVRNSWWMWLLQSPEEKRKADKALQRRGCGRSRKLAAISEIADISLTDSRFVASERGYSERGVMGAVNLSSGAFRGTEEAGLLDIPASGKAFTWFGAGLRVSCLDRFLVSPAWVEHFRGLEHFILLRGVSDHVSVRLSSGVVD
ncbi:hypothetical protein V6N13_141689 [Hibiscus sabdariffa]